MRLCSKLERPDIHKLVYSIQIVTFLVVGVFNVGMLNTSDMWATVGNKKTEVDQLGLEVWVNVSFQKFLLLGRLGSGPHLVGRIRSRLRVIASFRIFTLRILL